jgi:hypothetical protein
MREYSISYSISLSYSISCSISLLLMREYSISYSISLRYSISCSISLLLMREYSAIFFRAACLAAMLALARNHSHCACRSSMCEDILALAHPRVISAASFSPRTGHAVMTTCGDNRLRIWDDVSRAVGEPSRELVHSHDFNRYLSPFKAVWDPKDPTERTIMIGRCAVSDVPCSMTGLVVLAARTRNICMPPSRCIMKCNM